jgi:hypothetical protein
MLRHAQAACRRKLLSPPTLQRALSFSPIRARSMGNYVAQHAFFPRRNRKMCGPQGVLSMAAGRRVCV